MELRPLGTSGISVSPVIFGAWAIGGWMWGGSDEKDAVEAIHASLDAGVNTIDTAAVYGMGHSERLVAKALRGRRNDVIIATKCGRSWDVTEGSMPVESTDPTGKKVTLRSNSRPENIFRECEASLQRLETDVIDLYQIHWPDLTFPIEDAIGALVKLKEQGKIRAIGVSNYDLEQMRRASSVAEIASLQPPYSVLQRQIEETTLPFCREQNIGVICYSPLERGLLTGAVGVDRHFAPGDHRATHRLFSAENRRRVLAALESIKPIADRHRASFSQLIVAWTIAQPGITAALVGARNADQASHNAAAARLSLDPTEIQAIRAAFDSASEAAKLS
ncbi:MAG: aldo/keto reductase [Bdellovibrionota bacterium]